MLLSPPQISVCVCTYKRPAMLEQLLLSLAAQETRGDFTFDVVVADNDAQESARDLVERLATSFPVPLYYTVEPRRSIANVRNKTIAASKGDLVAFIDDDEFASPTWLLRLLATLNQYACAGVLGPVRPHYPEGTPRWVRLAGFFERPEHPTGHEMEWGLCRTGNVLLRRQIMNGLAEPFSPVFGTGGSDVDFFRRMIAQGHRFVWCNEAAVLETVAPSRWKRQVLFRRALLRGQNSFRHPHGRAKGLGKAFVAVPAYLLALPILALVGHHYFMKYFVKLGDHLGRLLAAGGLYVIKQRDM